MEGPIIYPEWYEFIDNEDKEKLDLQIDTPEEKLALQTLKDIDNQIPRYDLDLAIDRKTWKYLFISWNNWLKIPLEINQIKVVGDFLLEILYSPLFLEWYEDIRKIKEKSNLNILPDHWKTLVSNQDSFLSKKDVEELFVFAQDLQGVHIEDWKIRKGICEEQEIKECKNDLSNLIHSERLSWFFDRKKPINPEEKKHWQENFFKALAKKKENKKEQK